MNSKAEVIATPDLRMHGSVRVSYLKIQSRSARAGSVRAARHAGKQHAASAAIVITANAAPNASGSRGLTLYSMLPIKRVNPSATAPPSSTPPNMSPNPRDITSRSTFDAPAPSAMRNPSSRELWDTAYDITPYN